MVIINGRYLLLQIINCIPKSMNTIRNIFPNNSFIEYVVYSKCNKLNLPNDCIVNNNGRLESIKCSYSSGQNKIPTAELKSRLIVVQKSFDSRLIAVL